MKLLLTAVIACSLGCSGAQRCPDAPAPLRVTLATAAPAAAASSAKAAPTSAPRLSITITPDPSTATVDVEIDAAADPAALARWSIAADGGAGVFHLKGVRDAGGPIASRLVVEPGKP